MPPLLTSNRWEVIMDQVMKLERNSISASDMVLKSLSEMLVLNLETLSVELLKIFSAKTEHSSALTFYYRRTHITCGH